MIAPCLHVNDIETTIEWYAHFLGFSCTFKSTIKKPDYAVIENYGSKIFIKNDPSGNSYARNIIVIEVEDLDFVFSALEEKGVIFISEIESGVFGTQEFIIKDYEDNQIVYRERV